MVWGIFSWHSLGALIVVEGTMDQHKYVSVLSDHVHPYMGIVFPQGDMASALELGKKDSPFPPFSGWLN